MSLATPGSRPTRPSGSVADLPSLDTGLDFPAPSIEWPNVLEAQLKVLSSGEIRKLKEAALMYISLKEVLMLHNMIFSKIKK